MNSSSHQHPEIVLPDDEAAQVLRTRTRRGLLVGGIATLAGVAGYQWLRHAPDADGVPLPERGVLNFNGRLSEAYLSNSHLMPTYSPSRIEPLKRNGDEGLRSAFEPADWGLTVDTGSQSLNLRLPDIQSLPRITITTRFCCIEGWSAITQWGGARFSDFTKKYFPPGTALPQYVYMATPDEEYYVGLDMKSAMHPQTLLAWEQNGQPLRPEHGAPLRLAMPVKYGIKNIKRIGTIRYTDEKPDDYWAEEGYDWFAGL